MSDEHRDSWKLFDDPRFELRWRYPDPTPLGATVTRGDTQRHAALRVHFVSDPPGEIYFEVTRFAGLDPEDEYRRHSAYLVGERAATVSALQPVTLATTPGFSYTLVLPDRTRAVLLLPSGRDVYRILYDPRSPLNEQIVATVEWRD